MECLLGLKLVFDCIHNNYDKLKGVDKHKSYMLEIGLKNTKLFL